MSIDQNKALVVRFLEEAWSKGNLSAVDELIAPDHVHHLSHRDAHGPEGVKQLVTWFRSFLPDVKITIRDLVAEGDRVAAYFTFCGTDTGGYWDNAPSGNRVEYDGIDIFRLGGGQIVERWGIVDTIRMMHQIGAIAHITQRGRKHQTALDVLQELESA